MHAFDGQTDFDRKTVSYMHSQSHGKMEIKLVSDEVKYGCTVAEVTKRCVKHTSITLFNRSYKNS